MSIEKLIQSGQNKIDKALKIGALGAGLTAGLVLGGEKVEAQSPILDKGPKKELNATGENEMKKQLAADKRYLDSPQRYDLSEKNDISGEARERQTDPDKLLQYNIAKVKSRLEQTKNWLFIKLTETGADIVEPDSSDLKNQEKMIKEYEDYLSNPSLEINQVGDISLDQEDFELNQKAFAYHDQKIQEIANHINSPEYLQKLMTEYDIDEVAARGHQKVRLNNLLNGTYSLTNDDPNFMKDGGTFETKLLRDIDSAQFSDEHELLGHKVIDGGEGISRRANKLLLLSYQRFDPESPNFKGLFSGANNEADREYLVNYFSNYFGSREERYARKQEFEMEIVKLGVKKYSDKFTPEHYKKIIELYKEGKLTKNACRFIETTKPEYFESIFNGIASTGEPGKTYHHPGWDYNQPEKNDRA